MNNSNIFRCKHYLHGAQYLSLLKLRGRGVYRVLGGNRRERDHWGDLGVDGWIILGWISRRWDVVIWTGLGWPRIETDGEHL